MAICVDFYVEHAGQGGVCVHMDITIRLHILMCVCVCMCAEIAVFEVRMQRLFFLYSAFIARMGIKMNVGHQPRLQVGIQR